MDRFSVPPQNPQPPTVYLFTFSFHLFVCPATYFAGVETLGMVSMVHQWATFPALMLISWEFISWRLYPATIKGRHLFTSSKEHHLGLHLWNSDTCFESYSWGFTTLCVCFLSDLLRFLFWSFTIIIIIISLGACECHSTCRGHRTTCRSLFSSSTVWDLWMEYRWSGLTTSAALSWPLDRAHWQRLDGDFCKPLLTLNSAHVTLVSSWDDCHSALQFIIWQIMQNLHKTVFLSS